MKLVAPTLANSFSPVTAAAPRPRRDQGLVVGLLDNVKPNGDVAVNRLYELMEERGLTVEAVRRSKTNAGQGMNDEAFEALSQCDMVLNALAC